MVSSISSAAKEMKFITGRDEKKNYWIKVNGKGYISLEIQPVQEEDGEHNNS
jgi:hypothetical protein